MCPMTLCSELFTNGSTDRFAVSVVDSGGPKEEQVQSWEGTLAPPGEYDVTVRLWRRRRCSLM